MEACLKAAQRRRRCVGRAYARSGTRTVVASAALDEAHFGSDLILLPDRQADKHTNIQSETSSCGYGHTCTEADCSGSLGEFGCHSEAKSSWCGSRTLTAKQSPPPLHTPLHKHTHTDTETHTQDMLFVDSFFSGSWLNHLRPRGFCVVVGTTFWRLKLRD